MRSDNKYSSTNVELKVNKAEINGLTEYSFALTHQATTNKKSDGSSLPFKESTRRMKCNSLKAYARLHINGNVVAESKTALMKWPAFEFELCEMF